MTNPNPDPNPDPDLGVDLDALMEAIVADLVKNADEAELTTLGNDWLTSQFGEYEREWGKLVGQLREALAEHGATPGSMARLHLVGFLPDFFATKFDPSLQAAVLAWLLLREAEHLSH